MKEIFKGTILLGTLIIFLFSCAPPKETTQKVGIKSTPKNIIFMVGDGMGLSQISMGLYSNNDYLNLEEFKYIGLHRSYSSNDLITDSAAGGTAFSCGVKTYNGAIGVNPDTIPQTTILEIAKDRGMSTGLTVTSTIVHATPAAFYAHQKHRHMYEAIASDFVNSDVDLFIGGGERFFTERKDGRNLISELKEKGYNISSDFGSIDKIKIDWNQKLGIFTAKDDPLKKSEGRNYLPGASEISVNYLSRVGGEKGFFLMIEGSQIDWGGHESDAGYIIAEMIDFDKTIGRVLEFAKKDGETLVIITADHETGGFAINPGSEMNNLKCAYTTSHHTGTLIPVFAYGPGAEKFMGIYQNTDIFYKMKELLSL